MSESEPKKEIDTMPSCTEKEESKPQEETEQPRFETNLGSILERLAKKAANDPYAKDDENDEDFQDEEEEENANFSFANLGTEFAKMLQKQKQSDYEWLASQTDNANEADSKMFEIEAKDDKPIETIGEENCISYYYFF